MNHLQQNKNLKVITTKEGDKKNENNLNIVESANINIKNIENGTIAVSVKGYTNGKQTKEEEDLIEQDLSDVEDNYQEPSVQRYLPGIFVDVKLKTQTLEKNGDKISIPMIVDFYSECLKKYGDEKNFIYEESYLENMKVKEEDMYPELYKFPKIPVDTTSEIQPQTSLDNKQILNVTESQKNNPVEENLDDVIWLKNRPNDPLLRCIRSITDRLNIQGIVGDPTSYLKKGGDDMHYDMDDPFFDDSAMLSELKMSKSDILIKRAMEREFSDWSEEEEDYDYTYVEPEDFVADYYTDFEKELRREEGVEGEYKLYFYPSGWRTYASKIPKQFVPIFNEFETSMKKITEPITDKMLRIKIKELLDSIFKKLLKIPENTKKQKSKTKKNKDKDNNLEQEKMEEIKDQQEKHEFKEEEKENNKEEGELKTVKTKNNEEDQTREMFERRGINCFLDFRILDVNGKILRWIVKAIIAMTNSCSPYEIHSEWFFIVLANNEKIVQEQAKKIKVKLTAKLQGMKPKKLENLLAMVSESTKTLSKSIGLIRKLVKEHKDISLPKLTKSGQKDGTEVVQKKSLIQISLDSAREDHEEFTGISQYSAETGVKENYKFQNKMYETMESQADNSQIEELRIIKLKINPDKKNPDEETFQGENEELMSSTSNEENSETSNNQILEILETNSFESRPEEGCTDTPVHKLEFFTNTAEDNYNLNEKNEQESIVDETNISETKYKRNQEKNVNNSQIEQNIITPKKGNIQKDEDLEIVLKESKIMKRVKELCNIFKLVGTETLVFVQMSNLAITVATKINNKEFKHVVEHMGLTQNPFDQTYKRAGEIVCKLIQELYNIKITIPSDVMKVVVIKLQTKLKFEDLYEKKNKKPLLLFNNSKIKAAPGRVILNPTKTKKNKKGSQEDSPKTQKINNNDGTSLQKDNKTSPRKKNQNEPVQSRLSPTNTKENRNQEVKEPAKKKKKTQTTSRVNSLKELLLSRLRN